MKKLKTLLLALASLSLTVDAVAINITPNIHFKDKTYLYCYGTASVDIDGIHYSVKGKKVDHLTPKNLYINDWARKNGKLSSSYVKVAVNIPETVFTRNNANVPYLIASNTYEFLRNECQATLENIAKAEIKKNYKGMTLQPNISNIEIRGRNNRGSYDHQLVPVTYSNSKKINKIVSFGDSLSDTGNTNNYFQWVIPSRNTWYAGHFTNGWTWPEYAAKELGVNAHNEAWGGAGAENEMFDQSLLGQNIEHLFLAADYILPNTGDINATVFENGDKMRISNFTTIPGLYTQTEYFKEKITSRYNLDADTTLYTLLIGGNDFMNYKRSPDHVLKGVKKAIETLIKEHGAKNIAVLNLPDISLAPRFLDEDDSTRTIMKNIVDLYNDKLDILVIELNQEYSKFNVNIQLFNTAKLVENITNNPANYGLINTTNTCLENVSETYIGENKMVADCNGYNYLFWDKIHPTTRVHKILGKEFANFARQHYQFAETANK